MCSRLLRTKPSQILDRSMMVDRSALAALRIMNLLIFPAFFVEQRFIALLSCYGVKLCFDKGQSPIAAMLFSTYGMVMCVSYDLSMGYQFGETALKLAEDATAKVIWAKVQYTVANLVFAWKLPLQNSILMNRAAAEIALEVGDLRYVATSRFSEILCMFYAGESLDDILQRCQIYRTEIDRVQEGSIIQLFDVLQQLCQSFSIEPALDSYLCQDHGRESSWIADWKNTNNLTSLCAIYGYKAHHAYYFGNTTRALKYQDLSRPYWKGLGSDEALICAMFLDSLICLSACENANKAQYHKLLNRVKSNQKRFAKWSKFSSQNIQNRYDLVEAERYRISGKFFQSADYYDRSILAAKAAGFQHEEALANELSAKFYLGHGKEKIAATYMQEAYYCYARWGATAKTNDLEQHYPQLLIPIIQSQQTIFSPLSTLSTITNSRLKNSHSIQSVDTFDLAAVIQSAQALSSTLDITQLIHQLVEIILKNSGAETCILALPTSSLTVDTHDGEWQIHAIATVNAGTINVNQTIQSLVNNPEHPANLIYWIKNTQQTAIFDARQRLELDESGGLKIDDPYLNEHQPQSVFALPIVKQESVIGVLYLEHRHSSDIFTVDKTTIICFLCSQAAIALENATIYQQSQQIEIVLRQSQARYQKLSDNIPGVIYQFQLTPEGKIHFPYISSGCYELFQLEPAAVLADSNCLMGMIHLEDLAEFRQLVAESAQNMTPKLWEGRVLLSSGMMKWIKSASRPERQSDGSIVWDGVLLDITEQQTALRERVQAELDLAKSQQKYYNLIQSINGVVWEYDLTSDRFSFVSDRAVELFGYPISDWLSQANFWQNHIYPDDLEQALKIYDAAIENHQNCEFEYRLITADGRVIWVYDISTIVCDLDGNPISTNGLCIDISDLKQVETELQQANERLELTNCQLQQATRLKDEFLATMSHELRTPLNAILGMSEALQEEVFGSLNPRQIKSISTIEKSGEHLLVLINDILDVSKIAAGKLELNIAKVSLVDLCKSSLVFIKQKAFEKQIKLDTHFSTNLDSIFVDERRMCQVLINLLNNAIKFTPSGGVITLSISIKSPAVCHQTAGYSLCFDISDTGIGIASNDIAKLFQPFIQVDSNLNRKYEGTGLGLVLVKQIVELHGGFVSIASEVGKGSCFSIALPQTNLESMSESLDPYPSELSHSVIPANTPTAPLILLAEDNELNIHTFSSYLIAKGYQVIVANNGHEAIAMYQSQQPDLILMDVQMPNLDGIAAIKYIRQQSTQIQTPIIALTALAMPGDCEKCLAAGANKYLTKPLKLRELHKNIQECLDLN